MTLWDNPRQREAYEWFGVELANLRSAFRWAATRVTSTRRPRSAATRDFSATSSRTTNRSPGRVSRYGLSRAEAFPEIQTAIAHLRGVLGEEAYEAFARRGEAMTATEMAAYAYDQIDQARTTLQQLR